MSSAYHPMSSAYHPMSLAYLNTFYFALLWGLCLCVQTLKWQNGFKRYIMEASKKICI
jgi:hypothetical protein